MVARMASGVNRITKMSKQAARGTPRSVAIAERGVRTADDFTSLMSSLMSDLIMQSVSPQVGNAVSSVGGKMLKAVEMTYKYGKADADGNKKLILVND